ncbi:MAG: N-acetylmuramoyl-L-alanine amidase [Acaryochloris sp. RU_4_1]|nr:N-acetylmuramoyl-L-alanine amidase [Acaryochloris sp. RU_4_1]NJR55102.1 N-acetylmuramoyl-L-alanine amidase [Acaryochloris sp. CRU_2_0]
MKRFLGLAVLAGSVILDSPQPTWAGEALQVVYPANGHQTAASQIFLIGTAPPQGAVTVNGKVIERSSTGNFAPSFPLAVGDNTFSLQYGNQTLTLKITRTADPAPPTTLGFVPDSLEPKTNLAQFPNEPLCFRAIATANAQVSVQIARQTIPLQSQVQTVNLPANSAALTQENQPDPDQRAAGIYQGCTAFSQPGVLGKPVFQLRKDGQTLEQPGLGTIEILSPQMVSAVEVTSNEGVARTGSSTDYSRLTPLPKGTQARVTGRQGEWLRLDYGAWIKAEETRPLNQEILPHSLIRSLRSRQVPGWTEVVLPLQVPVPVSVTQGDRTFTLTLNNTTAQTDIIAMNDDPVIRRMDWQQTTPGQVQYQFHLKPKQQWGYKLRYEGTSLILSLRHPPADKGLAKVKVLLDPGHGSKNDLGSRGPTGVPEKDVTLTVSKLLQEALQKRGATVVMTRTGDEDLYPQDRVDIINKTEPTIAISVHYNALPDSGDALNTAGVGAFWYHPQSHDLAVFLHHYLVTHLKRPNYGIFWNNLALTRPTVAPSVLMELGFMIHPTEFEWITAPKAQEKLAETMAEAIAAWFTQP